MAQMKGTPLIAIVIGTRFCTASEGKVMAETTSGRTWLAGAVHEFFPVDFLVLLSLATSAHIDRQRCDRQVAERDGIVSKRNRTPRARRDEMLLISFTVIPSSKAPIRERR